MPHVPLHFGRPIKKSASSATPPTGRGARQVVARGVIRSDASGTAPATFAGVRGIVGLACLAVVCASACTGLARRLSQPSGHATPSSVSRAHESRPSGETATSTSAVEPPGHVTERMPPRPTAARPVWRTLKSEHFVLHTDDSDAEARSLLRTSEQVQATLARWFGAEAGLLEIVLYRHAVDYHHRFGDSVASVTRWAPGHVVLVTHRDQSAQLLEEAFAQAIARQILGQKYPSLPAWLTEGLVSFFGRVHLNEGTLWVGAPPSTLLPIGGSIVVAPLAELLEHDQQDLPALVLKSSAWALTGYLLDSTIFGQESASRFKAWLGLVGSAATPSGVRSAFTDIYPESSVEGASIEYSAHGRAAAGIGGYRTSIPAAQPRVLDLPSAPASMQRIEVLAALCQARVEAARSGGVAASFGGGNRLGHRLSLFAEIGAVSWPLAVSYGHSFARRHSFDIDVGKGALGHFVSPRYRFDFDSDRAPDVMASIAAGFHLSLMNETLGLIRRPARGVTMLPTGEASFRYLAFANEVGVGMFVYRGVYLRAALTLLWPLSTNLDDMCADPRYSRRTECPEVSDLAGNVVAATMRFGLGYAW